MLLIDLSFEFDDIIRGSSWVVWCGSMFNTSLSESESRFLTVYPRGVDALRMQIGTTPSNGSFRGGAAFSMGGGGNEMDVSALHIL